MSDMETSAVARTGKWSFTATELTISSGAITVTTNNHTIDTEGDGASDDLDTINGGVDGMVLTVRAAHTDRTVVLKDGTGNLNLGADYSMDSTDSAVMLLSDGTNWYLIAGAQTS